jgi:hypothetical protein
VFFLSLSYVWAYEEIKNYLIMSFDIIGSNYKLIP